MGPARLPAARANIHKSRLFDLPLGRGRERARLRSPGIIAGRKVRAEYFYERANGDVEPRRDNSAAANGPLINKPKRPSARRIRQPRVAGVHQSAGRSGGSSRPISPVIGIDASIPGVAGKRGPPASATPWDCREEWVGVPMRVGRTFKRRLLLIFSVWLLVLRGAVLSLPSRGCGFRMGNHFCRSELY